MALLILEDFFFLPTEFAPTGIFANRLGKQPRTHIQLLRNTQGRISQFHPYSGNKSKLFSFLPCSKFSWSFLPSYPVSQHNWHIGRGNFLAITDSQLLDKYCLEYWNGLRIEEKELEQLSVSKTDLSVCFNGLPVCTVEAEIGRCRSSEASYKLSFPMTVWVSWSYFWTGLLLFTFMSSSSSRAGSHLFFLYNYFINSGNWRSLNISSARLS